MLEGKQIEQPVYFIMGERDGVRQFISPDGIDAGYKDLRAKIFLDGKGHWLPMEAADEVNRRVVGFLSELR